MARSPLRGALGQDWWLGAAKSDRLLGWVISPTSVWAFCLVCVRMRVRSAAGARCTAGICLALWFRVGTRILIVEDDTVLRKHLVRLFLREGYAVSTAASRAAALEQLADTSFDVLLLDVKLPDGDGLDLLAGLSAERRPALAVVMSAFCTAEHERHAERLNICRLLRKPLDLLQLLDTVRHAVAQQRD